MFQERIVTTFITSLENNKEYNCRKCGRNRNRRYCKCNNYTYYYGYDPVDQSKIFKPNKSVGAVSKELQQKNKFKMELLAAFESTLNKNENFDDKLISRLVPDEYQKFLNDSDVIEIIRDLQLRKFNKAFPDEFVEEFVEEIVEETVIESSNFVDKFTKPILVKETVKESIKEPVTFTEEEPAIKLTRFIEEFKEEPVIKSTRFIEEYNHQASSRLPSNGVLESIGLITIFGAGLLLGISQPHIFRQI